MSQAKEDSLIMKRKATPEEVARYNASIAAEVKKMDMSRTLGIPYRNMHPYSNYSTPRT